MVYPTINSYAFRDLLMVQEAASISLVKAQYLKDAASTTLDLIAAAKVRLLAHMLVSAKCRHHKYFFDPKQCG